MATTTMTGRALNKEILRLAIPSILANITVSLVGMVDTAVAGHLTGDSIYSTAAFIGSIAVGSVLFDLLYWNFAFLRTSTGGLVAQAFGAGDFHECAKIFTRSLILAILSTVLVLALQWPFTKLAFLIVDCSPEAKALALKYFFIRIWAAPATLSLMSFRGWFVGMQDSFSSMWTDFTVNFMNIIASIVLTLGIGSWHGLGFPGIALGTVVAQYSGLIFAVTVTIVKYRKKVFLGPGKLTIDEIKDSLKGKELKRFMKMNGDLLVRSLCFTGIYFGFTTIAARYGDLMLACSSIMMKILMIFSFFTDGFAYAGEALTGRFIGGKDRPMLGRSVRYIFVWSMAVAVLFVGIYWVGGMPIVRLMSSDHDVSEACRQFIPWLLLMPPFGCAAFTWDGIYEGATATKAVRNAMLLALVSFFGVWFAGILVFQHFWPSVDSTRYAVIALHILMGAYFAHLLARTVYLSFKFKGSVLARVKD